MNQLTLLRPREEKQYVIWQGKYDLFGPASYNLAKQKMDELSKVFTNLELRERDW